MDSTTTSGIRTNSGPAMAAQAATTFQTTKPFVKLLELLTEPASTIRGLAARRPRRAPPAPERLQGARPAQERHTAGTCVTN